ncbi:Uncharacterized protein PCOAH_00021240 [Plasmodium coatneyi]|uniref:Uncharacterized protein n=1 Tax=Plasmodium coatneyi TaxID=208452 RepID=A0A1B1DZC7_9APIC|nr:Uncharacterized protein PCOAH_00021240 [Plasmodium coatneyi]ANQ07947.1 Uncharacterized protein PCOAH_00021240 [Plasmodium coatneyi]
MKGYIMRIIISNIAAFILFMRMYSPHNDSFPSDYKIGYSYNTEIISDIRFQRSLAEHEIQKELDQSKMQDETLEGSPYNSAKCVSDDLSEYEQMQESFLNDLGIYTEQPKHKYTKGKCLKRLDGYFEKKIFDLIDRTGEQQVGTSSFKTKLKESTVRKWGKRTIAMCLVLLLGTILPIFVRICGNITHLLAKVLYGIYGIFFIILTFIIIFLVIYIMTKVVKYHRLEAGRGKLKFKEYCVLCKDIFFP